jgi:hypothetical protein
MRPRNLARVCALLLVAAGFGIGKDRGGAGEAGDVSAQRRVSAADCTFERDPESYLTAFRRHVEELSASTERVSRTGGRGRRLYAGTTVVPSRGVIDDHIFGKMADDGIPYAPLASDTEFLRRVTLDLTGRIPSATDVRVFLADPSSRKRTDLIHKLVNSPEFVDKWTMFYGDLLRNVAAPTTTANIYPEGRNALYNTIRDFLDSRMPYDVFVQKIITANGSSWEYGGATYVFAMQTAMGPVQDTYDTFAARTATQFLGLGNLDCVLCHDGKGHLDKLNAWGATTTRKDAWELAAFFSRVRNVRSANMATTGTVYYWTISEATTGDYGLATTSGNRPARNPINDNRIVRPRYIFSTSPLAGATYRETFAANLIHDRQFARAAVNYLWKAMMGMGIVEPADQFDPKRLDPANLPVGWSVQPSHPELLEALTDDFIAGGFDVRRLLEKIADSSAYQLSSSFPDEWKIEYATYFARKFARRLWAEEVHDAITTATGVLPAAPGYAIGGPLLPLDPVLYAMQLPDTQEPRSNADGATTFMNYFMRGNRDTTTRTGEATVLQALAMMNNNFVLRRVRNSTAGSNVNRLLANRDVDDDRLIDELYLATLGRYASAAERDAARAALKSNRTQGAENLQWALLNKLDFLYNY